ncbi:MAG: Uma2 family endonuclease [Acidobacteriota bacterium]|nr:Uma2 family endonuclease [Acidobacteriota bacterium]
MGLSKLKTKISVENYLNGEEISEIKYEFVGGDVYAMAGTSQNHNRIARNIVNALSNHLQNSSCEPYIENIKVRATEDVFYYPDVLVTCEGEFKNKYFCEEPILIVEVTSPSTEQIDRREKLRAYQQMPSVIEYVIIGQEKISVEIHRRQPDGNWITYFYSRTDTELTLESVELTLTLQEIYRRVVFE